MREAATTRSGGGSVAHPLSLEQLTAWDASPPDFIAIAAELGCEAVSLWVQSVGPDAAAPPLVEDRILRAATADRLRATGIVIHSLECFVLTADTEVAAFAPALDVGAALGAHAATAIAFDPEHGRLVDNFGRLAALARARGLALNIEFLALSTVPNLAAALALVDDAGVPGCGIVVDSLHLTRSGGSAAELLHVDPALIGAIQICDGPAAMPVALQMVHEGFEQRLIPGEGAFALDAFVRALPPGRLIGVEVPLKDLADRGIPVRERARRAIDGTRRVLAQAAMVVS